MTRKLARARSESRTKIHSHIINAREIECLLKKQKINKKRKTSAKQLLGSSSLRASRPPTHEILTCRAEPANSRVRRVVRARRDDPKPEPYLKERERERDHRPIGRPRIDGRLRAAARAQAAAAPRRRCGAELAQLSRHRPCESPHEPVASY